MSSTEPSPAENHSNCMNRLEYAISSNPRVHHLLQSIEKLGCPIPKDFFSCQTCDKTISGGFTPNNDKNNKNYSPKIIMCDTPMDNTTFENTLVHELVHAYDQCKIKIDWKNCLHHACSEIRASSLSGECTYDQEVNRGHHKVGGGGIDCVKRRAGLSVAANPYCKDVAKDAILATYDYCSNDKAPLEHEYEN
jgi:mitochondrial inner membrane protease ATP23